MCIGKQTNSKKRNRRISESDNESLQGSGPTKPAKRRTESSHTTDRDAEKSSGDSELTSKSMYFFEEVSEDQVEIKGAVANNTKEYGGSGVLFLIKYKGNDDRDEFVHSTIINERFPQKVIKFYEARLTWTD